jgi:hypothetical protein
MSNVVEIAEEKLSQVCTFPLCSRKLKSKKFCFLHDKYFGDVSVKEAPKPIAKKSVKRKVEDKEYKKIVKEMLAENPNCEIKEEACTVKAQGLHHQKKRTPKTLLDRRYLIRACDPCNLWVELHPLEAIKKGYSISKFK